MEWKYAGESGIEVLGRNSHSLAIISSSLPEKSYIVVYGGASSVEGSLSDTIYSELPSLEEIGNLTMHAYS